MQTLGLSLCIPTLNILHLAIIYVQIVSCVSCLLPNRAIKISAAAFMWFPCQHSQSISDRNCYLCYTLKWTLVFEKTIKDANKRKPWTGTVNYIVRSWASGKHVQSKL